MSIDTVTLVAKSVQYGSAIDEGAFFYWLNKIEGVGWKGIRHELPISIAATPISNTTMRELIALFYRYRIDMRQLNQLVNASNKRWVLNPDAYWFGRLSNQNNDLTE